MSEHGDVAARLAAASAPRSTLTDRTGGRFRRVVPALAAAVLVALTAVIVAVHRTPPTAIPPGGGAPVAAYVFDGAQSPPKLIPVTDRLPAANFAGSLLSGRGDYDLATDARGEVTVINFWGAWCGPCQIETPQFQAIYEAYRKHHVAFVGIDIKDASRGLPRAFVHRYGITYPMIYDDRGQITVTLGNIPALGAPYTVLLDKHHRVAGVYLQRIEPHDLKSALNTLTHER